jgi:hypothetical protein
MRSRLYEASLYEAKNTGLKDYRLVAGHYEYLLGLYEIQHARPCEQVEKLNVSVPTVMFNRYIGFVFHKPHNILMRSCLRFPLHMIAMLQLAARGRDS